MNEKATEIMSVYKALQTQRAPWESWWDDLREYVLPRRVSTEEEKSLPYQDSLEHITDTTAIEACQRLASGHI